MKKKIVLLFVGSLYFANPGFAATDLNWIEGNWIGCEDQWLHEKAITSALGGSVISANKILDATHRSTRDFLEVTPESDGRNATMTFFTGTSVVRSVKCKMGEARLSCLSVDGRLQVDIALQRGASRELDVLHFVKTWGGGTHNLDMKRTDGSIPSCR